MSYKKYDEQVKCRIIEGYKTFEGGVWSYSKIVDVPAKTLYIWLENAGVLHNRIRKRKRVVNTRFTLEQKLDAVNQRLQGEELAPIAAKVGCSKMNVLNWFNTYKKKGVYFLASKKDLTKGKMQQIRQREYIKELEQKVYKLQMEVDAYEVVGDILGKDQDLSLTLRLTALPNIIKAKAISELRSMYKFVDLKETFDIAPSTYKENVKSLDKPDKYTDIKLVIKKIFHSTGCRYGYRRICQSLKNIGIYIAEKVVLRLMHELGLKVLRKTMRKFNSYKNDGRPPVKNWLRDSKTGEHFFRPEKPWEILGTDVTEFHLNGYKVYLSIVVDFYDSMIVAWSISQHPNMELMLQSLDQLVLNAGGKRFILHSDQGSCYRSPIWINACEDAHILQSMSRKGKSGDNAPVESVNGKIKVEFFHQRDFRGLSARQFINRLHKYINWYNNERIFMGLGGLSPVNYRKNKELGLAA